MSTIDPKFGAHDDHGTKFVAIDSDNAEQTSKLGHMVDLQNSASWKVLMICEINARATKGSVCATCLQQAALEYRDLADELDRFVKDYQK